MTPMTLQLRHDCLELAKNAHLPGADDDEILATARRFHAFITDQEPAAAEPSEAAEPVNTYAESTGPVSVVLGQEYRDIVTGFTGVATSRTVYLTGPPRVLIERYSNDKPTSEFFDEQRLETTDESTPNDQADVPLPYATWRCPDCCHSHTGSYVSRGLDPWAHDGRCINDAYPDEADHCTCGCPRRRPAAQ